MSPCWKIIGFKGDQFADIIVDKFGKVVTNDNILTYSVLSNDEELINPVLDFVLKPLKLKRESTSRIYYFAYHVDYPPSKELVNVMGNLPVITDETLSYSVCINESFRITEIFPDLANLDDDIITYTEPLLNYEKDEYENVIVVSIRK